MLHIEPKFPELFFQMFLVAGDTSEVEFVQFPGEDICLYGLLEPLKLKSFYIETIAANTQGLGWMRRVVCRMWSRLRLHALHMRSSCIHGVPLDIGQGNK